MRFIYFIACAPNVPLCTRRDAGLWGQGGRSESLSTRGLLMPGPPAQPRAHPDLGTRSGQARGDLTGVRSLPHFLRLSSGLHSEMLTTATGRSEPKLLRNEWGEKDLRRKMRKSGKYRNCL